MTDRRRARPRGGGVRTRAAVAAALATVLVALAGCAAGPAPGVVRLEFFQYKPEAIGTFDALIADFEAANPDIDVVQNHQPDWETAIRTRMVRDDIPDIMTVNAVYTFGELATTGVLADFAGSPLRERFSPEVLEIITELGQGGTGQLNALPMANNASGMLYNADLFARYGVPVPTNWPELITAAETFDAAGITPFYGTLGDAWTVQPAFNALGANVVPDGFYDRLRAQQTTFTAEYRPVAERLTRMYAYTQADLGSRDYDAGTAAFARGEAAILPLGSFAINPVRSFDPQFEVGFAALPATDDPADNRLITGVDVAVTLGAAPEHPAQAQRFLEYLVSPAVIERYVLEQAAISPLRESSAGDPALQDVLGFFEDDRITGYIDHQFPTVVPLGPTLQQLIIDGDVDRFLTELDDEWAKVAARRRS